MNETPNYYSILPANVRYDKNLSDFAKVLFSDIAALCHRDGFCSASNEYFAELFDKTQRTIRATISTLAEAGYISVEYERGENDAIVGRKIWPLADARWGAAPEALQPARDEKKPAPASEAPAKKTPPKKPKTEEQGECDKLFEIFWKNYPRRVAKAKARTAFDKLKPDRALLEKMLDALDWQTYVWEEEDARFIPHPSTWLNGHRWEDDKPDYMR